MLTNELSSTIVSIQCHKSCIYNFLLLEVLVSLYWHMIQLFHSIGTFEVFNTFYNTSFRYKLFSLSIYSQYGNLSEAMKLVESR